MEFASKGVAGAALGTGIAGLALGVLNGGLGNLGVNGAVGTGRDININAPDVEVARLRGYPYGAGAINVAAYGGGWGGYGPGCCEHLVNRYELNLNQQLNAKDAIITGQQSELFTTKEIGKVYSYVNEQFKDINNRFCYDEKQIDKAFCEIEKTNINLADNYIKAHKVMRPWDMCPEPITCCNSHGRHGERFEGCERRDFDDKRIKITRYLDANNLPTTSALAVKTVVIYKSRDED